jgi:alpha-beta hydrolase superfamily lysophospholipase
MLDGLGWISAAATQAAIPKDLPVHLLAGSQDPVGGSNGGLLALHKRYAALGIQDLSYKLYEGARHEMLNETNKEEVYGDLRGWLDAHRG